jgi:RHS repeat-associated protein
VGGGAEVAKCAVARIGEQQPGGFVYDLPDALGSVRQLADASANVTLPRRAAYKPWIGRFIQPDTMVPDPGNPQTLNRYSYAGNNPLKNTDPTGHCWGVASAIRGVPTYGTTCNNLDMALTIVQHPKASALEKAEARAYIVAEAMAHAGFVIGISALACSAIPACLQAAEAALGIGTSACADGDCTNEASTVVQTACGGDCSDEASKLASATTDEVINRASGVTFDPVQVQSKFKHAIDFGIQGNYNPQNAAAFTRAMQDQIDAASTQVIQGTYRGTIQVTHYFDPNTGNDIMVDMEGNFISAWKLSQDQLQNLLMNGNVQ